MSLTIKYNKEGKIVSFCCKRGRNYGKTAEIKEQKPLSEREKLIKKLRDISKPKFIY